MLLSAIGKREVPIPEHIDIYHLTREMPPSDKTPLQCVMEVDTERAMLEREAERLAHEDGRTLDPGEWGAGGFFLGKTQGA
jgi:ATP-binding cassette subfamily F protein 2